VLSHRRRRVQRQPPPRPASPHCQRGRDARYRQDQSQAPPSARH